MMALAAATPDALISASRVPDPRSLARSRKTISASSRRGAYHSTAAGPAVSHVDAAATLKGIVFLALQNRTASANDTAPAAPNARAVNVALASSLVDVIASARASRNRDHHSSTGR